ncbi:MAG: hypothetical protein U0797_06500 [Gemmataceae bacterium]
MLAALLLLAAVAPPPAKPSPEAIARWVEEMGDDSFAVREAASRKLLGAGEAAEPVLARALTHKDAEVRSRARAILAEFKWGVYADTPPAVVEMVRQYRFGQRNERAAVVRKLLAAGPAGCKAVVKIARAEEDREVRQQVFGQIASNLPRAAASLLEENNTAALDALFEVALAADNRAGPLNYAAYHGLRGRLPAVLAEWQARAKAAALPTAENVVLAYLHRGGGDLVRATAAAKEAKSLPLLEALLYEAADWKALGASGHFPTFSGEDTWLAYRTAYLRLAGSAKQYQVAIDDLVRRGRMAAPARGATLSHAKALFLNGRADLGLELLRDSKYSPKMTFEILNAQVRVKEALAAVEEARTAGSPELASLEILEARMLHQLGEKDKAVVALKRYADAVKPGPDEAWHQDLVEAELALGRTEEAFAATAKILAATNDPVRAGRLFDKLLDPKGDDALPLYLALRRRDPKEPMTKLIARLRDLVAGKGDVKALVESLRLSDAEVPAEDWRAAGEACAWAKQAKLAEECFRMASTARAWVRLGDLRAEAKDWAKAATHYHAAYLLALKAEAPSGEAQPCLALWLSGHALTQAGQAGEGTSRKERAHLLPLGDGEMRYDFVRALRKRGHKDAARREEEHLRRFGEPLLAEPNSYYTGEGLRAAAIEAAGRKDWLRAADGYEQTFLRCLQPSMNFTRASAYVTVAGHIYATRVRGLAAAGRIDEALAEAERAQRSLPAGIELAMYLVPELDRRGRKKEADALYRRVRERYAEVATAYPKCSWARNQMAWLSACCRRDLEGGLAQARRAVELAPDAAAYQDTLAEVLFQMGKKGEAIAAQKKAISLRPGREEYKRQLKRIEAGDPTVPRAEEDD